MNWLKKLWSGDDRPAFRVRSAESRNGGADIPGCAADQKRLAQLVRAQNILTKQGVELGSAEGANHVTPELRQKIHQRIAEWDPGYTDEQHFGHGGTGKVGDR